MTNASTPPITPPFPGPSGSPSTSLNTGMAVAAMVLGILGIALCPPLGWVGLVLGIIAVVRADRQPHVYGGRGMAIAGICTGGVSLLCTPIAISILLPSLMRARELSKRLVCASNLKGIATCVRIYAADYGGAQPPDLMTLVSSGEVTPKQLQCPSQSDADNLQDYYYVVGLDAKSPADWILAYEDPANHRGEGGNVVYQDARAEFLKEPRFTQELERFKADYEKACGRPPTIVPAQ